MADDPAFDDTAVELPPGRDEPPIGRTVATPGRLLREARERAGLHVGVLASTLKVSPRKLDALEAAARAPLSEEMRMNCLPLLSSHVAAALPAFR